PSPAFTTTGGSSGRSPAAISSRTRTRSSSWVTLGPLLPAGRLAQLRGCFPSRNGPWRSAAQRRLGEVSGEDKPDAASSCPRLRSASDGHLGGSPRCFSGAVRGGSDWPPTRADCGVRRRLACRPAMARHTSRRLRRLGCFTENPLAVPEISRFSPLPPEARHLDRPRLLPFAPLRPLRYIQRALDLQLSHGQ